MKSENTQSSEALTIISTIVAIVALLCTLNRCVKAFSDTSSSPGQSEINQKADEAVADYNKAVESGHTLSASFLKGYANGLRKDSVK